MSSAKWVEAQEEEENEEERDSELKRSLLVSIEQGDQLVLRCSVAANPLAQNTILQIEWLKDGRKLTTPPPPPLMTTNAIRQEQRIQIERANHLHMPATVQIGQLEFVSGLSNMAATGSFGSTSVSRPSLGSQTNRQKSANGNQLAASSKLIASSSLTINAISKQDSGLYSCHFKLIPAPSNWAPPSKEASQIHHQQQPQQSQQQQQQQQIKITSGIAKQTIQVNVIEGK